MSGYQVVKIIEYPQLGALRRALSKEFSREETARIMSETLDPVSKVALASLQNYIRTNHMGPTGNLLSGTVAKVVEYPQSGNATAIVGFRAVPGGFKRASSGEVGIGPDRAFHAGLLEFGTKPRQTKGLFASSYRRFGPFKTIGKYPPVKTSPAYPMAFFKRAAKGKRASTGSGPILAPIKNSFERGRATIAASVTGNAVKNLVKASTKIASIVRNGDPLTKRIT